MARGEIRPEHSAAPGRKSTQHFDELDRIATGLYALASMLVGEGEESIRLVETVLTNTDLSAGCDLLEAAKRGQLALSRAAIGLLARHKPASVAAPVGLGHANTCIGDDDLEAAGLSKEEFSRMIAGPDRDRLRAWLADLPDTLRVVFGLRSIGGFSSEETASLLASCGGSAANGWTGEAVREVFRQALCSLASQLIHATTVR
jgi:hypothetical protein